MNTLGDCFGDVADWQLGYRLRGITSSGCLTVWVPRWVSSSSSSSSYSHDLSTSAHPMPHAACLYVADVLQGGCIRMQASRMHDIACVVIESLFYDGTMLDPSTP